MIFNSYEFIFIFLPITFFIYFWLLQKRLIIGAKGFLVFASLFFYSWWNVFYLPLILSSMLFNYVIGNSLNKSKDKEKSFSRKSILIFSIAANLLLLGYYKYTDFFIENFNLAFDRNMPMLHLALPLAISFFTFQQIAYLVDSYRRETREYDFLNYALFVTFFPQLIAGPIVHHKEVMPQFASKWNFIKNYKNIALGLFIFSIGLFKKVVIADNFAVWATHGFDTATTLTFFEAWATSLSYTFQLYFDFSGYTDMAIGAALLFNIKLPINFNSPYKALDIQDFWRRWHITLSRFLRDYVYIPSGGSRKGSTRTYSNLLLTFILGGFWHGAGWTFVFWGFLHGAALAIHRLWSNLGFKMWTWLAWLITFDFVNIAWIFFRAKEWEDAIKVLKGMFGFNGLVVPQELAQAFNYVSPFNKFFSIRGGEVKDFITIYTLEFIIMGFVLISLKNSDSLFQKFKFNYVFACYISILFFISFLIQFFGTNLDTPFLYFNF